MKEHRDGVRFDITVVGEINADFTASTGISCRLLAADGERLLLCHMEDDCKRLAGAAGVDVACEKLHGQAATEAMRSGGRYIYTCPMGLTFFASPIMAGSELAGALVAGPVQIMEDEGTHSAGADTLSEPAAAPARKTFSMAPRRDCGQLQALSRLLFANAVYLSDNDRAFLPIHDDQTQSEAIDDYISYLKSLEGKRVSYPLEKEQELFRSIVRGDREMAGTLLNQILGHIYFYAVDSEEILIRIEELFVVLTRAAVCGGANVDHILNLSRKYLWDIRHMRTQEELTKWLASSLRQLTDQVFYAGNVKHSGAMEKAIDYMKRKYMLRITLEEVAEYAGYSPAYFSRIFREDTGTTFKEYLNELRIERSKYLLLSSGLTITEISAMLGFNDQSYFCKIFKHVTGITPDKFRKRSRRVDYGKE